MSAETSDLPTSQNHSVSVWTHIDEIQFQTGTLVADFVRRLLRKEVSYRLLWFYSRSSFLLLAENISKRKWKEKNSLIWCRCFLSTYTSHLQLSSYKTFSSYRIEAGTHFFRSYKLLTSGFTSDSTAKKASSCLEYQVSSSIDQPQRSQSQVHNVIIQASSISRLYVDANEPVKMDSFICPRYFSGSARGLQCTTNGSFFNSKNVYYKRFEIGGSTLWWSLRCS